jgi:hypothetical protein
LLKYVQIAGKRTCAQCRLCQLLNNDGKNNNGLMAERERK